MDPRTQRNLASTEAIVALLRAVIAEPMKYVTDTELTLALSSQGELAKFSRPDRGIFGSSINTLKRVANDHLAGGWSIMDQLRKNAATAIDRQLAADDRKGKDTGLARADSIADIKHELESAWRVNLVLLRVVTQALEDLQLIQGAKSQGERDRIINDSIERARASLLSNPAPFDRPEFPKLVPLDKP